MNEHGIYEFDSTLLFATQFGLYVSMKKQTNLRTMINLVKTWPMEQTVLQTLR